ncbi:MAG: hypothetical protein EBZ24_14660 [Synechococcaceae bacterium WB9_4xB_025]|nr:hypothetical protein [Synechococcaceae bacterium WB9_4xB_025]
MLPAGLWNQDLDCAPLEPFPPFPGIVEKRASSSGFWFLVFPVSFPQVVGSRFLDWFAVLGAKKPGLWPGKVL